TEAVNGHTFLLHDGRARSLEEAILWHGGEALGARDAFAELPAARRADLIRFLESL
ncbi:MAG: di-heme oxidoredictase family protein, partial [Pseudomonadota bacterium]